MHEEGTEDARHKKPCGQKQPGDREEETGEKLAHGVATLWLEGRAEGLRARRRACGGKDRNALLRRFPPQPPHGQKETQQKQKADHHQGQRDVVCRRNLAQFVCVPNSSNPSGSSMLALTWQALAVRQFTVKRDI